MDRKLFRSVLIVSMRLAVIWSAAASPLCLAAGPSSPFSKVSWLTVTYPPSSWQDPTDGSPRGIFIDVLRAVVGDDVDFNSIGFHPWSRSYHLVKTHPMTSLFPVANTAERRKQFKFSDDVVHSKFAIICRKSVIADLKAAGKLAPTYQIGKSLKDDSPLPYLSIGLVRDDVGVQLMRTIPVIPKTIIRTNSIELLIKKLMRGRIDAIAFNNYAAQAKFNAMAKKNKAMDPSQYQMIYLLAEKPIGFAFHPDMPQEIVDRFNGNLLKVKAAGTIDKILMKYLH